MITLENITKSFRRTKVLNDISLTFSEGDRAALIGSNGAGKTTLIRCILGQYVHDGTVTVGGLEPRSNREVVLKSIGFVPQIAPPLKMPVGELLRFCAGTSGISVSDIDAVGSQMEIDFNEIRSRPFVKLSGGQKQKILVSVAIARNPKLVIMDEPTANLDPRSRQALFDLLAERGDLPLLISSHRLEEVAGLVNRIVEFDRGRVVLDDVVADSGDLAERLPCHIRLSRPDAAFAKTITEWGFSDSEDGCEWNGEVAGADRLRFLGVLARYSGIVGALQLGSLGNTRRESDAA